MFGQSGEAGEAEGFLWLLWPKVNTFAAGILKK